MPRGVLILSALGLVGAGLVLGLQQLAAPRVAERQALAQERALLDLLPATAYDNRPLQAPVPLAAGGLLGNERAESAWVARRADQPVAALLPVTAPGYEGPIRLLTAFDPAGRLLAVKVLAQQETPGFAALNEPAPARWLAALATRLRAEPTRDWHLAADGGEIDALSGATITSRALLEALNRAQQFALARRDALFGPHP